MLALAELVASLSVLLEFGELLNSLNGAVGAAAVAANCKIENAVAKRNKFGFRIIAPSLLATYITRRSRKSCAKSL